MQLDSHLSPSVFFVKSFIYIYREVKHSDNIEVILEMKEIKRERENACVYRSNIDKLRHVAYRVRRAIFETKISFQKCVCVFAR